MFVFACHYFSVHCLFYFSYTGTCFKIGISLEQTDRETVEQDV